MGCFRLGEDGDGHDDEDARGDRPRKLAVSSKTPVGISTVL